MTPNYISWQIPRRAGPVPLAVNVGSQIRSHGLLSNACPKGETAASARESIRWKQCGRLRLTFTVSYAGANPGELPVQMPAKYRLVINLKPAGHQPKDCQGARIADLGFVPIARRWSNWV